MIPTLRVAPLPDLEWPRYAELLRGKLATRSPEALVIPINPGWLVPFDLRIPYDALVPTDMFSEEIVDDREVSQTFVSQCADLSMVGVFLATFDRPGSQPLILRLSDVADGRVIAELRTPIGTLKNNRWDLMFFEPLADSAWKRFRLSLTSPDSTKGHGVAVWRSRGDSYPGGEAFIDEQAIGADIAFKYGCREHQMF